MFCVQYQAMTILLSGADPEDLLFLSFPHIIISLLNYIPKLPSVMIESCRLKSNLSSFILPLIAFCHVILRCKQLIFFK